MGAEPLAAMRTCSRPRPVSTFLATILLKMGILRKRSSFFCGMFLKTPSWNFSQSRGTEMKTVGRARLMSTMKVSSDSAK